MTEILRQANLDAVATGMGVVESLPGEARIPLPGPPVIAFVGHAPRGIADAPVAITGVAEFRQRFGSPAERSRLELVLAQFFDNGGGNAVVVRIPRSRALAELRLPGAGGDLLLRAVNPGPREYLRAAVDGDGLDGDDLWRFNLTVQRVRSPAQPLVEEQESYRGVSVSPDDDAFVGTALRASALVRLAGDAPAVRPYRTDATGDGPRTDPGRSQGNTRSSLASGGYILAGAGRDAGHGPSDYDLIGSPGDCTGLHALDLLPRVDAVVLLAPLPDRDLGPVALYAAERYCRRRRALLLVDPPVAWGTGALAAAMAGGEAATLPPLPVGGANLVTAFPRLAGPDGRPLLSPLGLLAAWIAGGSPALPATLRSGSPPAIPLEAASVTTLLRRGVNVVLPATGGVRLVGGVTQAAAGSERPEWQDLARRHRSLRLVDTLARATRWVLLEARGPALWSALRDQVGRFLAEAELEGWFPDAAAGPAWYLKCDADTHARGAPPCFVVGLRCGGGYAAFRFVQALDACRVSEVVWQPGLALAN